MLCAKCGCELPEGTRFCTSCGAPQTVETTSKESRISGTQTDITITGYDNLTNAISGLRRVLETDVPGARKILGALPAVILKNAAADEAAGMIEILKEYGIRVEEPEEVIIEEPAPQADIQTVEQEMDAFIKSEEIHHMNLSIPSEEVKEEPEASEEALTETAPVSQSDAEFEAQMQAFLNGDK